VDVTLAGAACAPCIPVRVTYAGDWRGVDQRNLEPAVTMLAGTPVCAYHAWQILAKNDQSLAALAADR
jgi:hypothetical protein